MSDFNTIHVFAYGESQIISKDVNFKTAVGDFKTLQAVIDDVKSKKPAETPAKDYHAINIFSDLRADYNAKEKDGNFSTEFKNLDSAKLAALVAEFATLKAAADAKK